MPTDLLRAQHYRELAEKLRETAVDEPNETRRRELLALANQYQRLVEKLLAKQRWRSTDEGPGAV